MAHPRPGEKLSRGSLPKDFGFPPREGVGLYHVAQNPEFTEVIHLRNLVWNCGSHSSTVRRDEFRHCRRQVCLAPEFR
jgi:hypothetical protein